MKKKKIKTWDEVERPGLPSVPTIEQARKVLEIVDAGLTKGLGKPKPGEMCIEAAVCFALGEPHGDEPACVAASVRHFKIRLNDSRWSSDKARAFGMRKLAIAQLGSAGNIDERRFVQILAELTIKRVLPPILRKAGLEKEARACEVTGTSEAARAAKKAANASADADAVYAARYAANAAADAYAARYADANAAANAARYAADAAAVYAARYAARYAANAANQILTISAGCCLDALRGVASPGIVLLDQIL